MLDDFLVLMVKRVRFGESPAGDDVRLQYTIGSKSIGIEMGSVSSTGKTISVDTGFKSARLDSEKIFSGITDYRDSTSFELYSKHKYKSRWSNYNPFEDTPELPEPTHEIIKKRTELSPKPLSDWFESESRDFLPLAEGTIELERGPKNEIQILADSDGNIYTQLLYTEADKISRGQDIDVLDNMELDSFIPPCDYEWYSEHIVPYLL